MAVDINVYSHSNPNGGPNPLHSSCVGATPLDAGLALDAVMVGGGLGPPLGPPRQHTLTYPQVPADPMLALHAVQNRYHNCGRCHLSETRNKITYVRGNVYSPIVLLGDGPCQSANTVGQPFSGTDGNLQNEILVQVGIHPVSDVCWMQLLGCRAAGHFQTDRAPTDTELVACSERTTMLLRAIRPRVVVCLGRDATRYFFDEPPELWGWKMFTPLDSPDDWVMVGYAHHPSYLVRVIGAAPMYREYAASKSFYGILLDRMPSLTKVTGWQFMPHYVEKTLNGRITVGGVSS